MKRITKAFLVRNEACASQVHKFSRVFPTGAPVSLRSLEKAEKAGLSVKWLETFCDDAYRAQRKPLDDAYEALYDAYEAQCKILYDAYEAQCKPLLVAALLRYREDV